MTGPFALLPELSRFASDVRGLAATHGFWMGWNLVLAVVPVAIAFGVFRRGIVRTGWWWFGAVVFVLFLPNAPYVITDVVHLFEDIRGARSDLQVLGLYLPVYLLLFVVGFGAYVVALDRARAYVRADLPQLGWRRIELALHGCCAVGIYLGRVARLNSWEVFTRPRAVLSWLPGFVGPLSVALVVCTFVVLVAGTVLTRAFAAVTVDAARLLRDQWRDVAGPGASGAVQG